MNQPPTENSLSSRIPWKQENGAGLEKNKHQTRPRPGNPRKTEQRVETSIRCEIDVETILLQLKINDYFSWLHNLDSSKRLKYGL